ncbi:MAG: DNA-deoxyinosine glycosylase [Treponema sp.]|nr:DNA-deoxyinosine glycosylase [Treponema sp.]
MLSHPFEPTYDSHSQILILGSFPSVKSREVQYFYGHPRNRFWQVLASLFCEELPINIEEKKKFLIKHHIALWDVIASCSIQGSSDTSIKDVVPTDLHKILDAAQIHSVFTNGKKAFELYNKFQRIQTGMEAVCLPSTSPANAAWSFDRLVQEWQIIKRKVN